MLGNPRHSWILDFTPLIPDSRYSIPAFVSGTWILDSKCDSGFLSCILDSEAQDSEFHKQNFPGLQKPDSLLTFGEVVEGLK